MSAACGRPQGVWLMWTGEMDQKSDFLDVINGWPQIQITFVKVTKSHGCRPTEL